MYLDRKSAAAFLSLSGSTFDRWVERGIVPGPVFQEGRKRLWRETDLTDAIEGRRNRPSVITDPDEAVRAGIERRRREKASNEYGRQSP